MGKFRQGSPKVVCNVLLQPEEVLFVKPGPKSYKDRAHEQIASNKAKGDLSDGERSRSLRERDPSQSGRSITDRSDVEQDGDVDTDHTSVDTDLDMGRRPGLKKEEEEAEELRHMPTRDVVAGLLEDTLRVFKTASGSKNLKGSYVKQLYAATARIRAAAATLHERAEPAGVTMQADTAGLHREIQELREQVRTLKLGKDVRMAPLGSTMNRAEDMEVDSPPTPINPPNTRRKRGPPELHSDEEFPPLPPVVVTAA